MSFPYAPRDGQRGGVRVVAMGDLVIDVLVTGDVSEAREAGGAVRLYPGGSAANFAVAAAREGGDVTFYGCVGDDVAGRVCVGELAREGVTARVRVEAGAATGHVLVMHEAGGATRMISEPGASRCLRAADIQIADFENASALHMTGYSLFREGPSSALREGVRALRAASPEALVTFDPAPAHLVRELGREQVAEMLRELGVDLLLPNREEGEALTGEVDPVAIARALLRIAPLVVVKLGEAGCVVARREGAGEVTAVAAVVGPAVDTTGAGDAFAGAFVVAFLRDGDAVQAAHRGARAATQVIGRLGAR